jgi:hypothetical protein
MCHPTVSHHLSTLLPTAFKPVPHIPRPITSYRLHEGHAALASLSINHFEVKGNNQMVMFCSYCWVATPLHNLLLLRSLKRFQHPTSTPSKRPNQSQPVKVSLQFPCRNLLLLRSLRWDGVWQCTALYCTVLYCV